MYASVDLGGTTVACALASSDGRIIAERSIPTQSHEGPPVVLTRIGELVNELVAETQAEPMALGMVFRVRDEIRRRVRMFPPAEVRVERSMLGDKAGIWGGSALAMRCGEI